MSDRAILRGTESYLRSTLAEWNANNCQARPDDRPVAMSGKEFCAISIRECQTEGTDVDKTETWGFSITVSKRLSAVPDKKIADSVYLLQTSGLSELMNRIGIVIHNQWGFISSLNTELANDSLPTGFVLTEKFTSLAQIVFRSPQVDYRDEDWFHGTHTPVRTEEDGHVGISLTLEFGRLLKQTRLVDCP